MNDKNSSDLGLWSRVESPMDDRSPVTSFLLLKPWASTIYNHDTSVTMCQAVLHSYNDPVGEVLLSLFNNETSLSDCRALYLKAWTQKIQINWVQILTLFPGCMILGKLPDFLICEMGIMIVPT